jgi:exopolysaccharide biosynthesis polyprenyl glycosylphosphotransferase
MLRSVTEGETGEGDAMSEILRKSPLVDDYGTGRGRMGAEGLLVAGRRQRGATAVLATAGERAMRRGSMLRPLLMTLDGVAVFTAWLIVTSPEDLGWAVARAAVAALSGVIAIGMAGLYRARVCSVRSRELSRLVPVACLTAIAPTVLALAATDEAPSLGVTIGACALSLVFLVIERSGFDAWLRERRSQGEFCRQVVIVGTGPDAVRLHELFTDHRELGYRVIGFYGPEPRYPLPDDCPWRGDVSMLLDEDPSMPIGGVFVASDAMGSSDWNWVVRELLDRQMHVHFSGGPWGIDHRRLTSVPISHEPFFYLEPVTLARHQVMIKRTLDLVVATLGLIVTLPVMAVCALLIKLHDGGPLLFRQQRVGHNGQLFTFFKLRTMVTDAESMLIDLTDANLREGPLFKAENDPRVTPIGRFLRASSLDEIPQLFNVIRGDMSLVGPRPALPTEVAEFDAELATRHRVRPGISGLWQVEARDNPSFSAYRRLDLFYAENWSTSLDIVILLLTAEQVLARVIRVVAGRGRAGSESLAES